MYPYIHIMNRFSIKLKLIAYGLSALMLIFILIGVTALFFGDIEKANQFKSSAIEMAELSVREHAVAKAFMKYYEPFYIEKFEKIKIKGESLIADLIIQRHEMKDQLEALKSHTESYNRHFAHLIDNSEERKNIDDAISKSLSSSDESLSSIISIIEAKRG